MNLCSRFFSNIFSKKVEDYKRKDELLCSLLYKFDPDSMIQVENTDKHINRAERYIEEFDGGSGVRLDTTLFPSIKRVIKELNTDRESFWYKILKKARYKI